MKTELKLSANSLPIRQLPIHPLEVYCQFVSLQKSIKKCSPSPRLPSMAAKNAICASAPAKKTNAQTNLDYK